jgi:hypothetical protein
MHAALRGEPTDRIPYAPRLDLWFKAHQQAGTLPEEYRDASLRDLTDGLGLAYHGVVPDFRDVRGPEDDMHRALGIWNLPTVPVHITFDGVPAARRVEGDRTIVEYQTPHGSLRTITVYDEAMRRAAVTISHVAEPVFKSAEDYPALGHLFERARVAPNFDGFQAFAEHVGHRGLAVGWSSVAASPMHWIQRELMPLDTFFYEMHDHPEELARLAEQMEACWQQLVEAACASPCEVVLVGANYDSMIQYPPFFQEHILPWLHDFARALHAEGKYLLTHTDGENSGLLGHYVAAEIDIADSICPAPMTKLSFREVREAFAGRITIMGGIPSVALLPESTGDAEFERFLDRFFADIGRGDHLILGISDTTPPAAPLERILRIRDRARAFGPVRP